MVLQRAARSKDTTPVKQRPPVKPQPICPPNALAKGFTMGRGRPLSSSGQPPDTSRPLSNDSAAAAQYLVYVQIGASDRQGCLG